MTEKKLKAKKQVKMVIGVQTSFDGSGFSTVGISSHQRVLYTKRNACILV